MEGSPLGLDKLDRIDYDRICLYDGNKELKHHGTAALYYPVVAKWGEKSFKNNARIRAEKRDFIYADYIKRKQDEGFLNI